jgi:tetrahydromethanopterin S-methyltransferase subunit A
MFSLIILPCNFEVRGHCMCKEMPVIPVDSVADKKRIIGKNGGPRRRRGIRGC